jgi:sialidase-1
MNDAWIFLQTISRFASFYQLQTSQQPRRKTMMARNFLLACVLAAIAHKPCFARELNYHDNELNQVQVFQHGVEGYHTFRIPAVVCAPHGVLLAFAEGRRNNGGDTGAIDLVLKRSFDQGRTWGPLQVVGDGGANTFGNPTPIVDLVTGKVLLLTTHNAGNVTEEQVMAGVVHDRRVFVQQSDDNGATWSVASEITAGVKRSSWRYYATGPGHGIQLERGRHAGRLVAPCNHSTTNSANSSAYGAHLLLSDDHGRTWRIGADDSPNDGRINPNESSALELSDGRIYAVTRNQEGSAAGHRAVAWSSDDGETFDAPFAMEHRLISPMVEGALLRCADQADVPSRVLFSTPSDPTKRMRMTVYSSSDEARTWGAAKVIYDGPSAYSDLVKLADGRIGLLYESGINGPYEQITFVAFTAGFLDRRDLAPLPRP